MIKTYTLPGRLEGELHDTPLYWKHDDTWLDLSAGGWTYTIEARNANNSTVLWTKTTGVTGGVGSATVPAATIVWVAGDLGALTAGVYVLELTASLSSKALYKINLLIEIGAETA